MRKLIVRITSDDLCQIMGLNGLIPLECAQAPDGDGIMVKMRTNQDILPEEYETERGEFITSISLRKMKLLTATETQTQRVT